MTTLTSSLVKILLRTNGEVAEEMEANLQAATSESENNCGRVEAGSVVDEQVDSTLKATTESKPMGDVVEEVDSILLPTIDFPAMIDSKPLGLVAEEVFIYNSPNLPHIVTLLFNGNHFAVLEMFSNKLEFIIYDGLDVTGTGMIT